MPSLTVRQKWRHSFMVTRESRIEQLTELQTSSESTWQLQMHSKYVYSFLKLFIKCKICIQLYELSTSVMHRYRVWIAKRTWGKRDAALF